MKGEILLAKKNSPEQASTDSGNSPRREQSVHSGKGAGQRLVRQGIVNVPGSQEWRRAERE